MKSVSLLTLSVVFFLPLGHLSAQGSLTPPAGAPGPTMKTLDQVEARTPIGSAPFTITEPGSYYLTGNLEVTSENGVTIDADHVTLDLNGFSISSSDDSGTGVSVSGQKAVRVKNGTIHGFSRGLDLDGVTNCNVSDLSLHGNGAITLVVRGDTLPCEGVDIVDCRITIPVTASESYGLLMSNGIDGGINGAIKNVSIRDCSFSGMRHGLLAQCSNAMSNLRILRCSFTDHSVNAFDVATIGAGAHIRSVIVRDCVVSDSQYGVSASGYVSSLLVENCAVSNCNAIGIQIRNDSGSLAGCVVRGCAVTDCNTGISSINAVGARIDSNDVAASSAPAATGISVTISTNQASAMVFRNSVTGYSNNYSLGGTTVFGPIITSVGALSSAGTTSHPLANFSY